MFVLLSYVFVALFRCVRVRACVRPHSQGGEQGEENRGGAGRTALNKAAILILKFLRENRGTSEISVVNNVRHVLLQSSEYNGHHLRFLGRSEEKVSLTLGYVHLIPCPLVYILDL